MEGVTILSEIVTRDVSILGCIVLICLGIILLIVSILCLVLSIQEESGACAFLSAIIMIGSFVIGTVGIVNLSEKPYIVYKVTIDDNVSFNEFNEKYEIIKQDGLIYEVKEKSPMLNKENEE